MQGSPCLEAGNVFEERSLMSAEMVFMRKIMSEGEWCKDEKDAMELLVGTAKALERRLVKPLKGVIWVNESAARCAARVKTRGQPADDKIKARELYRLEELHCEMMQSLPSDIEVATFMDVTISTAPGIIKELCRWVEVLMIEGSTSNVQREKFRYISVKVNCCNNYIHAYNYFFVEWKRSYCASR